MGTIFAERTRLGGRYHLERESSAPSRMVSNYRPADGGSRGASKMFVGVAQPLAAAAEDADRPQRRRAWEIAASIRTARHFNSAGRINLVVNRACGGAARINEANVIGRGGARARVFGRQRRDVVLASSGLQD